MAADARLNPVLLRWMMLGEWRARPSRAIVAVLAIAIGVALGLTVHLVNRSALDEFARAVRTVNGEADLQIRAASSGGFDERLYPQVSRLHGIAAVSPVVEVTARAEGATAASITVLGLDVLRAAEVSPSLLGQAESAGSASGLDEQAVFLSQAALAAVGGAVGERLRLRSEFGAADLVIRGALPGVAAGRRVAVTDIATAQWRLGRLGRLQRLDLKLEPGANRAVVEAALKRLMPAGAQVVTPQTQARRSDNLSRAYRVNLQMLALVALLTGGFLVYSAQALSVARRRPQFALLRVLGEPKRGMLAQILVEGAVLGVIGAALGVAMGVGLAQLALGLFGGDLGGGYFESERPRLVFTPLAAGVIAALGLLVALGGSLLPALEAGRAQPAVALKAAAGDVLDPRRGPKPWLSLTLLTAGAAAAFAPPVAGLPILGYVAMALLLAGGVAAMPWLARLLLQPLRRLRNPAPPLALALSRLWGAPSQASIALCGIVASTSLMIAMAVMVSSFRGSVDEWLGQVLPSDLYVRTSDTSSAAFDPATQARMSAAPGVAVIDFRRTTPIQLSPDRPSVALIARAVDLRDPEAALPLIGRARTPPPGKTPAWISEPLARIYDVELGDRLRLPIGPAGAEVVVAGVWRDYSRQFGAVVLRSEDYTRLTGDRLRNEAAVELKAGAAAPEAIEGLRRALPADLAEQVDFAEPRQLRAFALQLFDRSFAVTYALEAIAVIVGLTGVAATFSAQTLARRKEFGMLRHVGVRRGQIIAMLAVEGALLGAVGAVAGAALGAAMSQVLIQVVNPQSFNWTMETRLPWGLFVSLAAALVATSAGTAVLSGRGALSDEAVRAVREDW